MPTFNHNGNYICECGKTFRNSQKFNGHKTQCKDHLIAVGKYENRRALQQHFNTEIACTGGTANAQKCKQAREDKLQAWIAEEHHCENCGSLLTTYYGSGRFCSRSCANSHRMTEERRNKISASCANTLVNRQQSFLNNFKTGTYEEFYCRSSYELIYLLYCKSNSINIAKVPRCFVYVNPVDNKVHRYIPDFYLPDVDCYVELKGAHPHFNFEEVAAKCEAVQRNGYGLLYIDDKTIDYYRKHVEEVYSVNDITLLYEDK